MNDNISISTNLIKDLNAVEYEGKQRELEAVANPILQQAAGAAAAGGGGSASTATPPADMPAEASPIEEID